MDEEGISLIYENNSIVSDILKNFNDKQVQSRGLYDKLISFLCLLDKLNAYKRRNINQQKLEICIDIELSAISSALWLLSCSDTLFEMCDPVDLYRVDGHLQKVIFSVSELLGELEVWPCFSSGRNTSILSNMKIVLEKIMLLPAVQISQVLQLCVLCVLYIFKYNPEDGVIETCLDLITTSRKISKKMSSTNFDCTRKGSTVSNKTKINSYVNKKKMKILQFEISQSVSGEENMFNIINEALIVVQNLCCTKLTSRDRSLALLSLQSDYMIFFQFIDLYVKAYAFIHHKERNLSGLQLWTLSQLTLNNMQESLFHLLYGVYLISCGFYASAHRQLVKAVWSDQMTTALPLVCSNYRSLITENDIDKEDDKYETLDSYIELLDMWKEALEGSWSRPKKLQLNFESAILNYIYTTPKYSDYFVHYEIARTCGILEDFEAASEEYLSLLAVFSTKGFSSGYRAKTFYQKQDIPSIRRVIQEAILVLLKSSQLDTASLLCETYSNNTFITDMKVECAEDFILNIKDDVVTMMLTGEVYMEMGKTDEAKVVLLRCIEVMFGCFMNLNKSFNVQCDSHIESAYRLLRDLMAKAYVQIADTYLKNYLMADGINFLQQSLALKPGNEAALLLYQNIHTDEDISALVPDTNIVVNCPSEDCNNLAIKYLVKGNLAWS